MPRRRHHAYVLVEASIGLTLLIIASAAALPVMRSAGYALQQARWRLLSENLLHNQLARVRAAGVREDGSLVLPDTGFPLSFETHETVSPVPPSSELPEQSEIRTQRILVDEIGSGSEGEAVWEYLVAVRSPSSLPDGSLGEIIQRGAVRKSVSR